jgi:outer membrane lipoprotein-sorting protein
MKRWLMGGTAGWLAVGGLALGGPSGAGPQDPFAIVGRAGRIYKNLSSLQADFVQILEDRAQGDTLTGKGTVAQAGNNYFAMRFSDPPGEAIVVDGKYIWTYTPSTAGNQVTRTPVSADPVYGVNLLAKVLDRPQDRYRATYLKRDTVGGISTDAVELVPTGTEVPFRRARLWLGVEDALPRRIELDESPGFRRILILSRLRPNAPYDRKTFVFEVPPGTRVIDGM